MISVITYGRNDNYGYNLHKRTAFGFNCLAESLMEEDEILFVDYNTPDHLPTLPEFIWDTFTPKALRLIKVIRVSGEIHESIKADSPLSILENVSRNAAIVRSNPQNHWVLSTNPDVLIVLASKWKTLGELLAIQKDSFYEMPRFDIPESIWSSLNRCDPRSNMEKLRDWLASHGAAIAEVIADPRFQRFTLFDAPGDFQLAPRDYFLQIRGFDETMNKYLHSDSNLARRMWLLNGRRTDHLVNELWVMHQDHYLSGEWARNAGSIQHNDWDKKIVKQWQIEANDENWGLKHFDLPVFNLAEKMERQRITFGPLPVCVNGDLPLSRDIDWSPQPLYHICHYEPRVLALYLREFLLLLPKKARIAYLGNHADTLKQLEDILVQISTENNPVLRLDNSNPEAQESLTDIDVLLVDCFYERSEELQTRAQVLSEMLQKYREKGRMREEEAAEEFARFTDALDSEIINKELKERWLKQLPRIKLRPNSYVILLGCNTYLEVFVTFQELFSSIINKKEIKPSLWQRLRGAYKKWQVRLENLSRRSVVLKMLLGIRHLKRRWCKAIIGHNSILGFLYLRYIRRRTTAIFRTLNLKTLYVHHRLVIMRAEGEEGL